MNFMQEYWDVDGSQCWCVGDMVQLLGRYLFEAHHAKYHV